jgi:hypothetical protein
MSDAGNLFPAAPTSSAGMERGPKGDKGAQGEPGPTGPPGPPGSGEGGAVFTQEYPAAAQWVINHNFGRHPYAVQIETLGGVVVDAAVQHVTLNQTIVMFDTLMAGVAKLA